MIRRLLRFAAFVISACVIWSGGVGNAQAASPWKLAPLPPTLAGSGLRDVAAANASNIWAVGIKGTGGPLMLRYNGVAWSIVDGPTMADSAYLEGVAADSASDAWAVGNGGPGPFVWHYNGTAWGVFSPPAVVTRLEAVAATSSTNVWVTGTWYDSRGRQHAVLLRWNGTLWATKWKSVVHTTQGYRLDGIVTFGPHNTWVAGTLYIGGARVPITVHVEGRTVTTASGPPVNDSTGYGYPLTGVDASSTSNVWAVGGPADYDSADHTQQYHQSAIAGYTTGGDWVAAFPPGYQDGTSHWLEDVAVASPTSVWAVGNRGSGGNRYNLMDFWNGTSWEEYGGPNPTPANELHAITTVPGQSGVFWAVGTTGEGFFYTYQPMILRCCS